ncbi:hypothetical protein Thena_1725 [Thermodesulfobium narugense DSM 14796]|uniref:Uncharacterized protein n=1 Tax=Thermodesulfobium narugense DSM 14796 TaxID=747365 RepID=M1E5Z7_9BACT|nr:hypothetical protein [Thermodesulfobium narugense]AEE15332.1 hypothetical protein Thena_1725 [Thermodesulfobium narugense DSM 14796]
MKKNLKIIFLLVFLVLLTVFVLNSTKLKTANANYKENIALVCFYKGEMQSTFNKVCFYDCLGTVYAINIKSYKICPLTIDRD